MIMDTPIRKMQKRNDYNRHKLLRKIKRQRQQRKEQDARIAEKELKRKLKLKQPRFAQGKDDITDPKANVEKLLNVQSGLNFNFDPVTGNTIIRDSYGNPVNTNSVQYLDELVVPGTDLQKKQQKALFNMTKGQELQMEDQARLQTLLKNPDLLSKLSNDPNAKTIGIDEANNLFADYNEAQRLAENLKDNDRYRMATLANMSSGERVNMVGLGAPALLNSALMYLGGAHGALMSGFASLAGMPTYMPSQLINQAIGGGIADNERFLLSGNSGSYLTGNPYGDTFLDIFSGGVGQIPQQGLSGLWRHGFGSAVGTGTLAASQGIGDLVFDVNGDEVRTPDAEQKQNMATALSLALASGFGAAPEAINSGPKRFNLFGRNFRNPLFNKYSKAYNDQIDRMRDLVKDIKFENYKKMNELNSKAVRLDHIDNRIEHHIRSMLMRYKAFRPKVTEEMIQKRQRRARDNFKYDDSISVFDNFLPGDAKERRYEYAKKLGDQVVSNSKGIKSSSVSETFKNPISGKLYHETVKRNDQTNYDVEQNFGELALLNKSRFSHTERNPGKSISSGFKEYIQELENSVRDEKGIPNGLVTGSSVLKAADYIAETPHDTEMITTEARYPKLIKQIDGSEIRSNPFATTLKSKKFWNSDLTEEGDVQIIRENPNTGNATGALALQIYRALYPAEFYKMAKQHEIAVKNGETIWSHNTSNWEVPMSAEQLYQSLIDVKNRERLVENDNFVRVKQDGFGVNKGSIRTRSALIYPDHVQNLTNIINDIYTANGFTSPLEQFKNLDFTNVAKNEQFLKYLGFADVSAAKNPEIVKNILNAYILSHSSKRTVDTMYGDIVHLDQMLRTNIAPYGGRYAGIGGNTVESAHPNDKVIGGSFTGALQPIITKNPGTISEPMDVIRQLNIDRDKINIIGRQRRLRQLAADVFKSNPEIHDMLQNGKNLYDIFDYIGQQVEYEQMSIKEGAEATQKLAEIFDINSFKDNKEYEGYYRGMLMQPNLGLVLQHRNERSPLSIEMGAFDKSQKIDESSMQNNQKLQREIDRINEATNRLLAANRQLNPELSLGVDDLLFGGIDRFNNNVDITNASIYTKRQINDVYDILKRYKGTGNLSHSDIKKLNRFVSSVNADIYARHPDESRSDVPLIRLNQNKFQKKWRKVQYRLNDDAKLLRKKYTNIATRNFELNHKLHKFLPNYLPYELYGIGGTIAFTIPLLTTLMRANDDRKKNKETEAVRRYGNSKKKHK